MKKVSYSAVVLDESSRSKLLQHFDDIIPNDWKKYAHHMTINMGEIDPQYEKYLGMKVTLRVTKLGISDKVFAVQVEGFPTTNEIPHITLAVNTNMGGKPFMSNKINDWRPIQFSLDLKGKVEEVG